MHLKPRKSPGSQRHVRRGIRTRVLPGVYTVKMTKGDNTYATQLNVTLDPRATYTLDDRKAQFDLVIVWETC